MLSKTDLSRPQRPGPKHTNDAMRRMLPPNDPAEIISGWPGSEAKQMGAAVAVSGPEFRNGQRGAPVNGKAFRPQMFTFAAVGGVPDFNDLHRRSQIVHVPVGCAGFSQVMCQSRMESSGTEGASDVDVITGIDPKTPQFSDGQSLCLRCLQDQGISSAAAGYQCGKKVISHFLRGPRTGGGCSPRPVRQLPAGSSA